MLEKKMRSQWCNNEDKVSEGQYKIVHEFARLSVQHLNNAMHLDFVSSFQYRIEPFQQPIHQK